MKKNELLFGSAYYLEYMPYNRLKEDIQMMRDAGMNAARIAESTWSTLEPESGVFCFDYVDAMLDAIEEAGMMAIIGTPTYAVPSWLVKKDPKVMVTRKEGQAIYGSRQIMDICNETFRFHAENVIRQLISHTAKRKCVIGFQIDNETKHYGTSGENVQKLFLAYLKDKFGTTDQLNKSYHLAYWSNSIARWEDLPDMRGCINAGLASEFEVFQRKLAAEYLQWQAEIVRQYAGEEQFVTHNLDFEWKKFGAGIAQDGYSYGIQPDICHYDAARILDIAGTDIYHMTQDELTGAEIAFGGDEIRSLKKDNYFVLECQAQGFKSWTPYPGQLRLQAYSHLASGAQSVMYWNWHSIHNGYETYWKGVLSHDLATNPTYEEACKIGKEFKELKREQLVLQKTNKIALVVDNRSLTAFKWFPIDSDLSYNDVVRWMYDSLYEMNLECDIVHADALEPEEYSILITPALYSVSDAFVGKMNQFVKDGGILISSFKSFVADRNLTVYHDAQPHGMTEVFGMSYNQFTLPGTAKLAYADRTFGLEYFAELLKTGHADEIGSYQHKYWGRYSAVTQNTYGAGSAFYVGAYTEKEVLKNLYEKAAKLAGIMPSETGMRKGAAEEKAICWPVIIRSGVNEIGEKVHYVLHYTEETEDILCPYACVTDLLTQRVYKKGDSITLKDWDAVILAERKSYD